MILLDMYKGSSDIYYKLDALEICWNNVLLQLQWINTSDDMAIL